MDEFQVGETVSVYAVIFGIHQNHRTGVLEYDIKIRDGDDVERTIFNVPSTDITTVFLVMHALIDADTPVISTAIVSEDVTEEIARSRLRMNISSIIDGCSKIDSFTLYVSGGRNFRKDIDPSYKANRTLPDPKYREMLRQYLIQDWGAIECMGYEADDACGIYQTDNTVIVGIDKDLLQVPGYHYSWPIVRKGVVQREAIWREVSEEQGWRNLFTQCLTGDVTDNIKGIRGIGHVKAAKILEDCHTEEEMYDAVQFHYCSSHMVDNPEQEERRFKTNLDLLYIWRSLGITYSIRREING